MSEQDLTLQMQEMMARIAAMQVELDSLNARGNTRTQVLPQPAIQPKLQVSTTRRKVLRRLAGGLVAGLAVGGIGASLPPAAEAKISSNPVGNGLDGRVGLLIVPPGSTTTGALAGNPYRAGLVVSGDTSFNLNVFTPTVHSAILASVSNNGTAISGLTQTGTAIYGQSNSNYGVYGSSGSGTGIYGQSTSSVGVRGASSSGYGVNGESTSNYGVYGKSSGNVSYGVYGENTNYTGIYGKGAATGVHGNATTYGVYGEANYIGLYGAANTYGVYATAFSSNGRAGYFLGDVLVNNNLDVTDNLSKGGGSFKIDHPLHPAHKYLYHSFVESPDMMNIYNGLITLDEQGEASVTMPEWFDTLNSDFRYQLTSIGGASPNLHIQEELINLKFIIGGGLPGQRVSWQVTGIRQDEWAKAHRIRVEEEKTGDEKGKYLHPELFGQPEAMSVNPRPNLPA